MRGSCLLLVAVAAVLIADSEQSFLKRAVGRIVSYVRRNCTLGIPGGLRCSLGRRRRSVDNPFGPWQNAGLQNGNVPVPDIHFSETRTHDIDPESGFDCASVTLPFNEVPRQMMDETFRAVDGDQDDHLNPKELNEYRASLKIAENCVERQNLHKRKK